MMASITGILLLGGSGTRLRPLTNFVNKHLLPVYNAPMALHAVRFLNASKITELILSVNPGDLEMFERALRKDAPHGVGLRFVAQDGVKGTARAIEICEPLIKTPIVATLWGDNLFEYALASSVATFAGGPHGGRIHTAVVSNPHEFGVVELSDGHIISIEDNPQHPKSHVVTTGFMLFKTAALFSRMQCSALNARAEHDMMDIVRDLLSCGILDHRPVNGWWKDAGTSLDTLYDTTTLVRDRGVNKDEQQA